MFLRAQDLLHLKDSLTVNLGRKFLSSRVPAMQTVTIFGVMHQLSMWLLSLACGRMNTTREQDRWPQNDLIQTNVCIHTRDMLDGGRCEVPDQSDESLWGYARKHGLRGQLR